MANGERRRHPRRPATLWVRVVGADARAHLRRGNISASGIFIAVNTGVGPPGSILGLEIATEDRRLAVRLRARVVRVVTVQDERPDVALVGVAFEFFNPDEAQQQALDAIIAQLAVPPAYAVQQAGLPCQIAADEATAERTDATIQDLGVVGMVLETSWSLKPGDPLTCFLQAPASGQSVALTGYVTAVVPPPEGGPGTTFRVTVSFADPPSPQANEQRIAAEGMSITDALGTLLDEALSATSATTPEPSPAPAAPDSRRR
jgi:hypothetical protein